PRRLALRMARSVLARPGAEAELSACVCRTVCSIFGCRSLGKRLAATTMENQYLSPRSSAYCSKVPPQVRRRAHHRTLEVGVRLPSAPLPLTLSAPDRTQDCLLDFPHAPRREVAAERARNEASAAHRCDLLTPCQGRAG